MHILLTKMSSMGDVVHTLPALTDALQAIPDLTVDWVVESAFADIPLWHPAVHTVLPIQLRCWRKHLFSRETYTAIRLFYKKLREKQYDLIIDAQGLLKSAVITRFARGKSAGYDKTSIREKLASYVYTTRYTVSKEQHAVSRIRELFAKALGYPLPTTIPNYGIDIKKPSSPAITLGLTYVVFLHGTTWDSKHYPESYWCELLEKCATENMTIYLPWGNTREKERAERLAQHNAHALVLPKLSIAEIAGVLKNAKAIVAVDTGLGHLSAALNIPTLSLYGPTDAKSVGTLGKHQSHLQVQFPCAPCKSRDCVYAKKHHTQLVPSCFETIKPTQVWEWLWQHYNNNSSPSS